MAARVVWRGREEWALFKIKAKPSGVAVHGNSHRMVLQNEWNKELCLANT
jgi:hypothetical protein